MKRKLLIVVAVLLVLVVGGAAVALYSIDSIAKRAIESGGTYALGTKTSVSSVSVGLLSGKFSLTGLSVANPSGGGFKSDHFLALGSGGVDVSLSTLRKATIELPRFGLSNLDVNLEKRDGKTNYDAILAHVKQTMGGDKSKTPSSSEKRYIIHDLDIQNVTIRADLVNAPAIEGLTRVTIPIDRITLTDVGKTGTGVAGTGVTMSELASIVVNAVLKAATEKGGGLLPAELLNDLQGKLAAIGDFGKIPIEVIAGAKGTVEEVGKKAIDEGKKALEGAAEQGKKAVDDVTGKIKDLIPGDKDKKKK